MLEHVAGYRINLKTDFWLEGSMAGNSKSDPATRLQDGVFAWEFHARATIISPAPFTFFMHMESADTSARILETDAPSKRKNRRRNISPSELKIVPYFRIQRGSGRSG